MRQELLELPDSNVQPTRAIRRLERTLWKEKKKADMVRYPRYEATKRRWDMADFKSIANTFRPLLPISHLPPGRS